MVKNNILSLNRRRVIMAHFAGIAAALVFPNLLTAQSTSYNANSIPVSGTDNAAFGTDALFLNTSGKYNVAIGLHALRSNSNGNNNTAVGYYALRNNSETGNTAVGFRSLTSNTTGTRNTATGAAALTLNTTGGFNTANGYAALNSNTTGISNVAVGVYAMLSSTTGSANTATGRDALRSNTTGNNSAAYGFEALYSSTTGRENVAIGSQALYSNTTGRENTATGFRALRNNTTASGNTATGSEALVSNTTGSVNVACGYKALYANTTGSSNVASGFYALGENTTGGYNVAAGYFALRNNTTGDDNVAIGDWALYNNLTGTGNTGIGHFADVSSSSLTNATAIGNKAMVNASNKIRLGDASVTVVESSIFYMTSDKRFKSNISEEDVKGLEFIKKLRPVVYNLDAKKLTEFWTKNMSDSVKGRHLNQDFSAATAIRQTGFIAQEVEAAAKEVNYDFNGVHVPENENDNYSLAYSQFVVPLVKGMQEQQKMIEEQKLLIEALQQQVNQLVKMQDAPAGALSLPLIGASMEQNMPNPFTHETVINFELPQQVHNAYMSIYDLSGKTLQTLPIGARGASSITITADRLAAGMYMYSIVADGKLVSAKRMVVANKQ